MTSSDLIVFVCERLYEEGLFARAIDKPLTCGPKKTYVLGYDAQSSEGEKVLRQLALRYPDHPDFREEFRP